MSIALAGACGGSTDATAPVQDSGPPTVDTDAEAGPIDDPLDTTYPAPHAAIPPVDFNGGRIMTAPRIVTVTFDGDPMRDRLEAFGDMITATPWWDAVIDGYCNKGGAPCIGHGTGGEHVHLATPPAASYTDSSQGAASSIQDFITAHVADGTFPAPTPETIYAIYFPDTVSIDLDGSLSCGGSMGAAGFGAYHNTITLPTPLDSDAGDDSGTDAATPTGPKVNTPYAIMPRCGDEGITTVAASHEFIETATDPDIGLAVLTYYMQDQSWASGGGEVGDVCVDFSGSGADVYMESGFAVQRSWSNKAAKASHNPCVPGIPGSVYFNVAPPAGMEQLHLGAGQSKVLTLDAFSDAPMPADWVVTVKSRGRGGSSASLALALDKSNAHNGSHLHLTVTLKTAPPSGYAPYTITSTAPDGTVHRWYAAVNAL
ncbi:MAG: hypothetical protein ABIP39_13720 [Polyangiaceae bacterium]